MKICKKRPDCDNVEKFSCEGWQKEFSRNYNLLKDKRKDCNKMVQKKDRKCSTFFPVLIVIHSMQDWTATMRHGVTRKKKHKMIKAYTKSVQKKPTIKRCLLILDLKPFKS